MIGFQQSEYSSEQLVSQNTQTKEYQSTSYASGLGGCKLPGYLLKFYAQHKTQLWVGTLLSTLSILPAQAVVAPNVEEVGRTAKQFTVLIQGDSSGSGVIVEHSNKTYQVLTANHVVAKPQTYTIVTPDGQRYPVASTSIKSFAGTDLATLRFNSSKSYAVAQPGNSDATREGKIVYVAGFPQPGKAITDYVYTFTIGRITAHASKSLELGYTLVYSNMTLPGMSGGPVLNEFGKLIGIHGRAEIGALEHQADTVYLKTGFNLGIPINTFTGIGGPATPGSAESLSRPSSTATSTTLDLPIPALAPRPSLNLFDATGVTSVRSRPLPPAQLAVALRADDFFLRAGYKVREGNISAAIADYTQAIKLNPNYTAAYTSRGIARSAIRDEAGAIADLNRAITLNPNLADAYTSRGLIKSQQGDTQGAIIDYTQAVKLEPTFARAYYNRGVVYYNQGKISDAIGDLQKSADLYLDQGNADEYRRTVETLSVTRKNCRQSIRSLCDG
jgi:serine protease Do